MLRRVIAMLALFGLAFACDAAAEALPRPAALEPNIRFWTRIYTEIDTQGGLIHDSEHLDIVYETLRFPSGLSARERERRVEDAKRRYAAILRELATGRRTGLSEESARVLALWPEGTSDATLRAAALDVRFQLGQADKFRAGLIRAGQWRRHIEGVLAEQGVPTELVALPHVESSFNPRAYSHVGAAGLWQFMRSTGRLFLRIDDVIDERMDPHAASVAAARLLAYNYRQIDSWPLAITAYNHGLAGMARAVRELGTRDIATIVARYQSRSFGFASRNFYAEFLAASAIDHEPDRYFGPLVALPDIGHEVVTLDYYYPVASLQRALGVDLEALREYNPALRPAVWSGAKFVPRGYPLRVPKRNLTQPVDQLLASVPPSERLLAQHRDRFYKVRRGDTLSTIADRQSIALAELAALNNLRGRKALRVGQVLRLPDHASGSAPVVLAQVEPVPSDRTHRVRSGDTLASIARRYGVTEAEIVATNELRSRNVIVVGQQLRLPGGEAPAAAPAATPETPVVLARAEPAPVAPTPQASESASPAPAQAPQPAPEPEPVAEAPVVAAAAPPPPEPENPVVDASEPEPAPTVVVAAANVASDAANALSTQQDPPTASPSSAAPTTEVALAPAPEAAPEPEAATEAEAETPVPSSPDPSNYSVSKGGRITVQADETLGHYAEWLELRPSTLRRLNGLKHGAPVRIGHTAKLDFRNVTPEVFEQRRLQYHLELQEAFFEAYVVSGTETHVLKKGESLWYLAKEKFDVPLWLLRQYNPDLDFDALRPGTRLVIPVIEPRENQG